MAWFRTNRGVAVWLAFFALAFHLSFSFGHVHVSKFGGLLASPVAAQTTDATGDAPSSPTPRSPTPLSPTSPSPPNGPAGASADFCAVCANINLAGALLLPILAFILAPGLFINVLQWPLAAREPASFGHRPFSARGPPHA
jgi:hypothetical protein